MQNDFLPGWKKAGGEKLRRHTGGGTMKNLGCILGLLLIIPNIALAGGTWLDTTLVPPSLGFETPVRIYLPEGYDPGGTVDYPVIYWLHAWYGTHTQNSYETLTALNSLISSGQIQPVILVKPHGFYGPYDGCMWVNSILYGNFEDYVVFDLVNFIDSSFCTIVDPEYRCIAGHSMGAQGSMRIALEHTDRYRAVASHSGFNDFQIVVPTFASHAMQESPETEPPYTYDWGNGSYTDALFLGCGGYAPNLGAPDSVDFILDENGDIIDSVYALWELHNSVSIVKLMTLPIDLDIFFDCGTNDAWDGCYESNCGYSDTLTDLGIDHEFQSLSGVGHGMNLSRFIEAFLSLGYSMTGIGETSELYAITSLEPAFPNPFTNSTTLSFQLHEPCHTTLQVFDLSGRLIDTLIDGKLQEGHHSVEFNAENYNSGIYLYRLQAGSVLRTMRCVVLR